MRNFVNYNSHHIVGYKIKEGGMGGACSTKTSKEMYIHNFVKTPEREKNHLKTLNVEEGLILTRILKTRRNITGGIHLAHVGKKSLFRTRF